MEIFSRYPTELAKLREMVERNGDIDIGAKRMIVYLIFLNGEKKNSF
jgi:hypothetical protein